MEAPLVSTALWIEPGPLSEPLREAVAAIDAVHQDGSLRTIPMLWSLSLEADGQYKATANGVPQEIVVSQSAERPHWTALHEIGHYLDHQALDVAGRFASVDSAFLQSWREVVDRSDAVSLLRQALVTGKTEVFRASIGKATLPVNQEYVRYQLQYHELFARSYAQWIAVKSGHQVLRWQLHTIRNSPSGQKYRRQWKDDDFGSIAAALESLMQQRGWMV